MDLETFKTQLQQAGYSEVVEKSYAPDTFIDVHTHPFAARALITSGEMSITCGDEARTYRVGDLRTRRQSSPCRALWAGRCKLSGWPQAWGRRIVDRFAHGAAACRDRKLLRARSRHR